MLTNISGTVVWQQHTTPFGEITETIAAGIENLKSFPGQYRDSDTGYSYNYFRDYDPCLGRYIQSDPIGLNGGLNTYGYVGGNPIAFLDPYGLASTGNYKLDPAQVEAIKEQLKDPGLDKKTRSQLKQTLKRQEKRPVKDTVENQKIKK